MTVVSTRFGRVRGIQGAEGHRFLGVPYAAPPVGRQRFTAPAPLDGWTGIRDAQESGPAAPQSPPPAIPSPPRTSEDCLYLDVYTPTPDGHRRPVLVWLHGGAFRFGWAGDFDGSTLAAQHDLVVVSVGYRLGLLGFAPLDHLDSSFAGSANGGIRDQIAALGWVHDNIAAFGGDPTNVTLCGQSAGGESVAAILAAPAADGLYRRAIVQSATVAIPALGDRQRRITDRSVAALGATHAPLEGLVTAEVDGILAAQSLSVDIEPATFAITRPADVDLFPSVDGVVVTRTPLEAVADRGADGVPLILGTTRHEGMLLDTGLPDEEPTETDVREAFAQVGIEGEAAASAYAAFRPGGSQRDLLVDALTDSLVRAPTIELAEAAATRGAGAWVYLFAWETDLLGSRHGAIHAVDLPFLWTSGESRDRWSYFLGTRARPETIGAQIRRAWAAFARDGDPNGEALVPWAPYDDERRSTLVLDDPPHVTEDPDRCTRILWSGTANKEEHA